MTSRILRQASIVAIAAILAAFFAFVGWHKAFSPLEVLVQHGAYTAHLPEWLGRLAGYTELACAAALLAGTVPRWGAAARWGAIYVLGSQILAGTIHVVHGETGALPANLRWMGLAGVLLTLTRMQRTAPLVKGQPT